MSTLQRQAHQVKVTTTIAMQLVKGLQSQDSLPRIYLAEMIVVRLFALLQAVIEDSACRLICGAKYCDGSLPQLLRHRPTNGFERARKAMRFFNRSNPDGLHLRWISASTIKENLQHLLPANEHFISTIDGHGQFISDLRKVRNHIAHGNVKTRKSFDEVVRNNYGANVNTMTPGRMLLSSRFEPNLIEQYCRSTKVILLAVVKDQT